MVGTGGHSGKGFQPTILGVQQITVNVDDEAKEGLVYAMNRLQMNHADAARWLLTNVEMPGMEAAPPHIRHARPQAPAPKTSGKRLSARFGEQYDPGWED